jgi:hypothetical protein
MKRIFYKPNIGKVQAIINHVKVNYSHVNIKASADMSELFQVLTDGNEIIQGNDAINAVCDLVKGTYDVSTLRADLSKPIKLQNKPTTLKSKQDANTLKKKFEGYINRNYPLSVSKPFDDINKNKVINIKNAKENLGLFHDIMSKYKFEYRLVFGTLLGIHRGGDLIPHDQDIDAAIHVNQLTILEKALPELAKNGFNVTRFSKGLLISLSRNDEYIDLYIFTPAGNMASCGIYKLSDDDFVKPTTIEFIDRKFKTVTRIEAFLVNNYGSDWKTPIKGKSANPKNNKR